MRRMVTLLLGGALLLSPVWAEETGEEQEFRLIVNTANTVDSMSAGEISRIFLKKQRHWRDGSEVMPVDLPADSPVRVSFTNAVHGRPVPAVKSYWQRMIFSGREVPPEEATDSQTVIALVQANPNAVGYVDPQVPLTDDVKELHLSE